jgi:hypothetical protein
MALNNVRAVGDDRPWKDEVERELYKVWDVLRYGKITLRAAGASTGGGGGGGGADLASISATLPATYNGTSYVIGVDEDAFSHISNLEYAQFDTTSTAADGIGILKWSQEFETLETKLDDGVTIHFGQDHLVRVKNASGSVAIPKMSVVMFAGANGDTVSVAPAVTDGSVSEDYIVGVTTEEIPADGFGFVTQFGFITNLDTDAYSLGDLLWADPTVAGALTTTPPVAPNLKLPLAAVTRVNASSGRVLVRAYVGKKLGELHDVTTTGATNGQVLAYNSTTGVWGPVSVTGTGTVTSVDTGTGLTGGPITTSGTITLDADLNDLNGITITGTPADNELLAYNSGTSEWINQTADEAGIVQVYQQTTEPTGKIGDVWVDTSSEVNSWSSFMAYSMSAGITGSITSAGSATVTFPAGRFSQAPIVTATANVASSTNARVPHLTSITTSGFTIFNVSTNSGQFNWVAVQISPTSGAG